MNKVASRLLTLSAAISAITNCGALCNAAHLASYEPAPRGLILISRPTITWPLFLGSDTQIDTIALTVNGISYPITYDPTNQVCTSVVTKPLPTGDYLARINITFTDGAVYEKDWQFSVSPDAKPDFPAGDSDEKSAADIVNAYRKLCGLPPVVLNPALGAAADAHCRYMDQNKQYGHKENTSLTGFTGESPQDRVLAWGYAMGDYEDIGFSAESASDVVAGLFDAPYHRVAFLQPGSPDFGYSGRGGRATLEFGETGLTGETVYPADGQKDVPTSWTDDEFPDPLRLYPGALHTLGYPISLFCYGSTKPQITVQSVSLTTSDGSGVPIYANSDANDTDMHGGVVIFAQSPMAPGTTYTVKVAGSTVEGADISRTWSFTTAAAPSKGSTP